ncbi:unnamed protein product [Ectocarpus sp. CCAP 1310/34]|nr:unnamed protein product [Ectocarpus sp. CCAP 1310/34]CAB1114536.1 unnamed protein product [Ectocarpus sp. CCAP 1310/34]
MPAAQLPAVRSKTLLQQRNRTHLVDVVNNTANDIGV